MDGVVGLGKLEAAIKDGRRVLVAGIKNPEFITKQLSSRGLKVSSVRTSIPKQFSEFDCSMNRMYEDMGVENNEILMGYTFYRHDL